VPGPVRWLDAVLTAPLPNVTWASSIITAIADVDTSAGGEKALSLLAPEPEHVAAQAATPDRPIAVQILTEQVRIVAIPGDPEALRRRMAAVEGTISSLLSGLDWSVREGELAAATAEAAGGMPEELQELIAGLGARVKRAAEGFTPAPASAVPPLASGTTTDAAQPTAGEATQVAHVLKVDQAKVDALMNLIAELVVSKNSLPFLARRAEDVYGSREMGREIKDQYAIIDRLAQEMQRATMDVRMLPVSEVFELSRAWCATCRGS
jgi:two-component system chemotaxis sensor kinase CheA